MPEVIFTTFSVISIPFSKYDFTFTKV